MYIGRSVPRCGFVQKHGVHRWWKRILPSHGWQLMARCGLRRGRLTSLRQKLYIHTSENLARSI